MHALERHIKHHDLKAYHCHNEWLHHTEEVTAYYQEHTNIDIAETLQAETEKYQQQQRDYQRRYNQRPDIQERQKAYQQEYSQRPDIQERERKRRETPEYKEQKRVNVRRYDKKRKQTPEYRERERKRQQKIRDRKK